MEDRSHKVMRDRTSLFPILSGTGEKVFEASVKKWGLTRKSFWGGLDG
jgi:hypothetical protein